MRTAIAVVLGFLLASCQQGAGTAKTIDKSDQNETIAYSLGADIGQNVANQDSTLDVDAFLAGFRDGYKGDSLQLNKQEMMAALSAFRDRMVAKRETSQGDIAKENRATAEKFLEVNAEREGVVELPSGLQYFIEREGKGTPPTETDTVRVHYRGTLVNGQEFDSSYKRGQPAEFPVNGVIPGWTEALQLMKPGAKWRLYIPPDLAYGDRGAGPKIKPGSALQFEVELLEVVDNKE